MKRGCLKAVALYLLLGLTSVQANNIAGSSAECIVNSYELNRHATDLMRQVFYQLTANKSESEFSLVYDADSKNESIVVEDRSSTQNHLKNASSNGYFTKKNNPKEFERWQKVMVDKIIKRYMQRMKFSSEARRQKEIKNFKQVKTLKDLSVYLRFGHIPDPKLDWKNVIYRDDAETERIKQIFFVAESGWSQMRLTHEVKGKIVFFNGDQETRNVHTEYSNTYRPSLIQTGMVNLGAIGHPGFDSSYTPPPELYMAIDGVNETTLRGKTLVVMNNNNEVDVYKSILISGKEFMLHCRPRIACQAQNVEAEQSMMVTLYMPNNVSTKLSETNACYLKKQVTDPIGDPIKLTEDLIAKGRLDNKQVSTVPRSTSKKNTDHASPSPSPRAPATRAR